MAFPSVTVEPDSLVDYTVQGKDHLPPCTAAHMTQLPCSFRLLPDSSSLAVFYLHQRGFDLLDPGHII